MLNILTFYLHVEQNRKCPQTHLRTHLQRVYIFPLHFTFTLTFQIIKKQYILALIIII